MTIFISDLHIGVGHNSTEPDGWSRYEDFRWDDELRAFLKEQVRFARSIAPDRKSHVDLVLVGDTFELWQSVDGKGCHPNVPDAGCTESDAQDRLCRIVEQHPVALDALGWFAEQDDNRVTLVPGNHDAALLFEKVRNDALAGIKKGGNNPLRAERVRVATEGYWRSRDGLVYAEHGHQIGDDPNRFAEWPKNPFIKVNGTEYLRQPWGEALVQDFFNDCELDFPTIDNLSDELVGFEYGIKAGGVWKTGQSVWKAARFLLTQTSWKQTVQLLGPMPKDASQDPKWKVDMVRGKFSNPEAASSFVIEAFPPGDPVRTAIEKEVSEGRPLTNLDSFQDEELNVLCSLRWFRSMGQSPEHRLELCPGTVPEHLGGVGGDEHELNAIRQGVRERLLGAAKDQRFREHLKCVRDALPSDRPTQNFDLFVFAHTHEVISKYSPFGTESWSPTVINDGAWQRTATPAQFCAAAKAQGLTNAQALRKFRPQELPACYPYVMTWINDQGRVNYALNYWIQGDAKKTGAIKDSCPAPTLSPENCN